MYKILLSKKSKIFLDKNKVFTNKVSETLHKFVNFISGKKENIDVKKMKGDWDGYYRINIGKIRIIFSTDINNEVLYVERIGYRGDIYK